MVANSRGLNETPPVVSAEEPARRTTPSHCPQGWKVATQFVELMSPAFQTPEMARYVPNFQMALDDLSEQTNADLQGRVLKPFQKLALWALRDGRTPQQILENTKAWLPLIAELTNDPTAKQASNLLFRYILATAKDTDMSALTQSILEPAPTTRPAYRTIADALHDQGVIQGIKQGQLEGIKLGQLEGIKLGQLETLNTLCESFDITLSAHRKAILDNPDTDLKSLIKVIATEHCWPETF